jgi:8-oxo-dGTP diphosphatase
VPTSDDNVKRYVGVIASCRGRIVLVLERHGPDGQLWSVPGGHVESGETPVEGATRELAEETGLRVAPAELQLVATAAGAGYRAWTYAVEVGPAELAPDDPDGLVLDVGWFDAEAALAELARVPYRPMVEAVVAYLNGTRPVGAHWHYG